MTLSCPRLKNRQVGKSRFMISNSLKSHMQPSSGRCGNGDCHSVQAAFSTRATNGVKLTKKSKKPSSKPGRPFRQNGIAFTRTILYGKGKTMTMTKLNRVFTTEVVRKKKARMIPCRYFVLDSDRSFVGRF